MSDPGLDAIDGRFDQAEWLMAEVGHRRDYWGARRHPFSERWAAGRLSEGDLQTYAAEHHHVVAALADISRRAAALAEGMLAEELRRHAAERSAEIDDWCRFARATGWSAYSGWYYAADPLPETAAGARTWSGVGERSLAGHLVTIYALETAQAEVARLQLDALLGHYGFSDGPATRSLRLRCRGDAGPAGLIEAALTGLLPVADPFALVRQAELAYRAYWELLDGIERFSRTTVSRA